MAQEHTPVLRAEVRKGINQTGAHDLVEVLFFADGKVVASADLFYGQYGETPDVELQFTAGPSPRDGNGEGWIISRKKYGRLLP